MQKTTIALLLLALTTTGCVTSKAGAGAAGGAAGGALLGQAVGRNTGGTIIGAVLGGVLGYMVGNEMDKNDISQLNRAYETAPSHRTTAWVNPDSGREYAVTPRPAYVDANRRDCREAEILTTIDGKAEKVVQTACRENGRWVAQ